MRFGKDWDERSGGGDGGRGATADAMVACFEDFFDEGIVGRDWGDGAAVGLGCGDGTAVGRSWGEAAALVMIGPETERC